MSARVWFAREAQFTADPKIQILGHEFGAAGPLAVEELFALAKLAAENGDVTITYAMLAGRAFTTPAKARQVVARAEELGIVTFSSDPGPKGCSLSLPRWSRWQVNDPTAAERKRRQRDGLGTPESQECHATDRDISETVTPLHRQRQTTTPPTPPGGNAPKSDVTEETVPVRPMGGRKRDIANHEQRMAAWVNHHFPGADPRAAAAAISFLQRGDKPNTAAELRQRASGHPIWAQQLNLSTTSQGAAA